MIKVLIVDDDVATVEVIRDSVHWDQLGIGKVYTVNHVLGAKNIMEKEKIDIVVSDIEMPKETGLDFLKWVRETGKECEFLLLTCHENFTYAAHAISFEAAAYLTKPFDIDIMEMTLQKIMGKIIQKRSMQKNSEYGKWMEANKWLVEQNFWKMVLEGELIQKKRILEEISLRHLEIDAQQSYCMIYTWISNAEADMEKYEKSVFEFVMEEFHSEILTEKIESHRVIKMHEGDTLCFFTICQNLGKIEEKCNHLLETCEKYFNCTITGCISELYYIEDLHDVRTRIEKTVRNNMSLYGKVWMESRIEEQSGKEEQIMDFEQVLNLIKKKDKAGILHYIKRIFEELAACRTLNADSLYQMKQEMIQVVYSDLMQQGIQATRLFHDELSRRLSERAVDSTVDMVRWINYMLEKTFRYEEEIEKSMTIIDKIQAYVKEHYAENIGRNEVAAVFYLTPEYLAKLYKKKTGINLKDYINEYRIERAKELLRKGEANVSDVAFAVGFDNFSYFSTLFKKVTGVSPRTWQKSE